MTLGFALIGYREKEKSYPEHFYSSLYHETLNIQYRIELAREHIESEK